jgi:hypothetical protein
MIHLKLATQFNLIEFDEEEVETTDEKQSDVSCASQGNAAAFLPGYGSKSVGAEIGEPSEEEKKEMMEAYQDDIENGEYPYVDEDGTEILDEVEATEEEINHMLHGVDNNPEVVISETDPHGDEDHVDGVDELPEEVEEEVTVLDLSPELVDLDAEEDEDWDKLEKAGVITPVKPEAETETVYHPEGDVPFTEQPKLDLEGEEEEVPWIEDGEEPVELEELSEEEEELEEVVDEEVSADLEMQEIKTEEIIEEKEAEDKPVESTGVLFDLEEGEEPGVKPVVGLDEPVQIMSPEESAEKSQLPAFTNAALGLGYDQDVITEWAVNGNYDGSLSESENLANFRSWAALMDSDEPGIEDEPVIGETQEMSAEEVIEEYGENVPEEPTVDKSSPLYVAIQNELEELYGYKPEFTYTETNDQFNIVLESGESVVLSAAYINSLV